MTQLVERTLGRRIADLMLEDSKSSDKSGVAGAWLDDWSSLPEVDAFNIFSASSLRTAQFNVAN